MSLSHVAPVLRAEPRAPEAFTPRTMELVLREILLACGIVSSLLYVVTIVLVPLQWEGYSSISQTVSELSAIGAPTRSLVVSMFFAYALLVIAFGVGIWRSAGSNRILRVLAVLQLGYAGVCLTGPWFPMHLRGDEPTMSDTMHVLLTIVTVLLILLTVGFGARAFGKWFRTYSIFTIFVLVLFGALAFLEGPRIHARLPTPWIGLTERINIGGYLLWVAVLAAVLLRRARRTSTG